MFGVEADAPVAHRSAGVARRRVFVEAVASPGSVEAEPVLPQGIVRRVPVDSVFFHGFGPVGLGSDPVGVFHPAYDFKAARWCVVGGSFLVANPNRDKLFLDTVLEEIQPSFRQVKDSPVLRVALRDESGRDDHGLPGLQPHSRLKIVGPSQVFGRQSERSGKIGDELLLGNNDFPRLPYQLLS